MLEGWHMSQKTFVQVASWRDFFLGTWAKCRTPVAGRSCLRSRLPPNGLALEAPARWKLLGCLQKRRNSSAIFCFLAKSCLNHLTIKISKDFVYQVFQYVSSVCWWRLHWRALHRKRHLSYVRMVVQLAVLLMIYCLYIYIRHKLYKNCNEGSSSII